MARKHAPDTPPAPTPALPPAASPPAPDSEVRRIPLDLIDTAPENRVYLDAGDPRVLDMAESILLNGQIQPGMVRLLPNGRYETVVGECRLRALRLLAEQERIPCATVADRCFSAGVRVLTDEEAAAIRREENVCRTPLSPMEEAEQLAVLLARCGGRFEEAARRCRLSVPVARMRARLANLSPAWRDELARADTTYTALRDNVTWLEQLAILDRGQQDVLLAEHALEHARKLADIHAVIARYVCRVDADRLRPWPNGWDRSTFSGSGRGTRIRCGVCKNRSDKVGVLPGFDPKPDTGAVYCLNHRCYHDKAVEYRIGLRAQTVAAMGHPVFFGWDGFPNEREQRAVRRDYRRDGDAAPVLFGVFPEVSDPEAEPDDRHAPAWMVFVGGPRGGLKHAQRVRVPRDCLAPESLPVAWPPTSADDGGKAPGAERHDGAEPVAADPVDPIDGDTPPEEDAAGRRLAEFYRVIGEHRIGFIDWPDLVKLCLAVGVDSVLDMDDPGFFDKAGGGFSPAGYEPTGYQDARDLLWCEGADATQRRAWFYLRARILATHHNDRDMGALASMIPGLAWPPEQDHAGAEKRPGEDGA